MSLRGEKHYIATCRARLMRPILPMWAMWFIMSFFPPLGLMMYTAPTVVLTGIPIYIYCDVWTSFGYKKSVYLIINIAVLIISVSAGQLLLNAGALDFFVSLLNPALIM